MATKYYQLDYVSRFHCDAQKCSQNCCTANWNIFVDKDTYEKYSCWESESGAKELIGNIEKVKIGDVEKYVMKRDKNSACPFLNEDGICSIQRKHGEDFLPNICFTYPRNVYDFKDFLEVSLSLSCPVAAELVLSEKEPLKIEEISAEEKRYNKISVEFDDLPQSFTSKMIPIQETAISILQRREMTIDQRLLVLGLYFEKLNRILTRGLIDDTDKVVSDYRSSDFVKKTLAGMSNVINFSPRQHIITMLGLLESLYGMESGGIQTAEDRKFLEAVINTIKLKVDENNQTNVIALVQNYSDLKEERKNFIEKFSTIFENYLVNECFTNLYPFKFAGGLTFNYCVFVTIYKMLELVTFSVAKQHNSSEQDLIQQMIWYAQNTDHNPIYIRKILDQLQGQNDIVRIMQNMLQV